jgi:CRISPR-associated protein (TIGR03984 family)
MTVEWQRVILESSAGLDQSFETSALSDLPAWLCQKATDFKLNWLLAHFDDGVVWGRFDAEKGIVTSRQALAEFDRSDSNAPFFSEVDAALACSPQLRFVTLQQARLFSDLAELLLWRDGNNQLQTRMIQDAVPERKIMWRDAFDEPQMLWGTHGIHLAHKFTLLRDGQQGLRHAVPFRLKLKSINNEITRTPCLIVRHYLADESFARVVVSRLAGWKDLEEEQ